MEKVWGKREKKRKEAERSERTEHTRDSDTHWQAAVVGDSFKIKITIFYIGTKNGRQEVVSKVEGRWNPLSFSLLVLSKQTRTFLSLMPLCFLNSAKHFSPLALLPLCPKNYYF